MSGSKKSGRTTKTHKRKDSTSNALAGGKIRQNHTTAGYSKVSSNNAMCRFMKNK